jgi:putative transposase
MDVGLVAACDALGVARATYYRDSNAEEKPKKKAISARGLGENERAEVLAVLHEPRFVDLAPTEVYATLLEEGRYLCAVRTMYRILAENSEVRERRDQLRHPIYTKPELLATAPNQLWSWDITKLLGPVKWTYFHLYVIMDVFSRYVVGWLIAERESATLAEKLIHETCKRQQIAREKLTLHADRGSSMKSKPVALLLSDLGVTKTHSRPHVSNDNPYSEAHFKTMKYRPEFPGRFGSLEDARSHSVDFFRWYNDEHYHSGLALFTPADVHHQRVDARIIERQAALDAAFAAHPERFPNGSPVAPRPALQVWINKPQPAPGAAAALETPTERSPVAAAVTGAEHDPASVH